MSFAQDSPSAAPAGGPRFLTTHWSVVIRAGVDDTADAQAALSELCGVYWYPLYAFVRRLGRSPQDAEDLTQAFFARLLEKNYIAAADQEKGRFRTFLLVALKRFLANRWDREHAQKRGGFATVVSLDQGVAESRFEAEPAHDERPDMLFERQWAMTLLEQVLGRLQAEYAATDRAELFGHLRACLTKDEAALPYAEIGARLNLSEGAVKMAVQRLRVRYRELLREEIAKTVDSPDDIEDELRQLFAVFSA
jgi:RNA polymerase sigma-70 factor (ECF subfamily)